MTVADFKKKAHGIYHFAILYKNKWYKPTIDFDNYIITTFTFEADDNNGVICLLNVVEPQK